MKTKTFLFSMLFASGAIAATITGGAFDSGTGIGDITGGNSVFVDQSKGNDATGAVESRVHPYKTLAAAKAAAVSGYTIYVGPGSYSATNLLKDGVNWHFETGARVTNSSATLAIFDNSVNGVNAPVTSVISGNGVFDGASANDGTSQSGAVLYVRKNSGNIRFTCESATAVTNTIVTRSNTPVYVKARTIDSTGSTGNAAIWWFQGSLFVEADTISSSGPATVYSTVSSSFGYMWVNAKSISNSGSTNANKAVWFQDTDATAREWVNALQISGPVGVKTDSVGSFGYVKAEKVFGQIEHASGGTLYVDSQKVADGGLNTTPVLVSGSGIAWLNISHIDDTGISATVPLVSATAGTLNLRLGSLNRTVAGNGIAVSGGATAIVTGGLVSTQAGSFDLFNNASTLRAAGVLYTTKSGTVGTETSAGPISYTEGGDASTAMNGDRLLVDTSVAAVSITLPITPIVGDTVAFVDSQGTFATHNLTVLRNGESIDGSATDLTASTNNASFRLIFVGDPKGWQVVREQ